MREIEFRGKEFTTGEWVYGNLLIREGEASNNKQCFIIHPIRNVYRYEENKVIPETVGQYTGLKDKNGVKIFEGDIIRVIGQSQEINVVAYDEGTFSVGTYEKTDAYPDGVFFTMWYLHIALNDEGAEVIGNIFDNGGLLDDC